MDADREKSDESELSQMPEGEEAAEPKRLDESDDYANGCLKRLINNAVLMLLLGILYVVVSVGVDALFSIVPHNPNPQEKTEFWQERLSDVAIKFDSLTLEERIVGGASAGYTQIMPEKPINLGTAKITAVRVDSSFFPYGYEGRAFVMTPTGEARSIEWSSDGVLYPGKPTSSLECPGMYVRLWFDVKYASCSFDTTKMYAALTVGKSVPQYSSITLYPADGDAHKTSTMSGINELAKDYREQVKNAREHPGEIDRKGLLCVEGFFKYTSIKANNILRVKIGMSDDALEVVLPKGLLDEVKSGTSDEGESGNEAESEAVAGDETGNGSEAAVEAQAGAEMTAEAGMSEGSEVGDESEVVKEHPAKGSSASAEREKQMADGDNYAKGGRTGSSVLTRKNNFGLDGFDECDHLFEFIARYEVRGEKRSK